MRALNLACCFLVVSSGYNEGMTNWRHLILSIGLIIAMLAPVRAETWPQHVDGELVTDVSGKLPAAYLGRIEAKLRAYPFHVETVYLPDTKSLNLGLYAAKLADHWHLPPDSMLVVVALDRRKIGVHAGKALKAKLKQGVQDKEVTLPTPKPAAKSTAKPRPASAKPAQATPSPEIPLDLTSATSHLELVGAAIDNVTDAIKAEAKSGSKPSAKPSGDDDDILSGGPVGRPEPGERRGLSSSEVEINPSDWMWIVWLLAGVGLFAGVWFGQRFLRTWSKTNTLVNRFSQQGQIVYEQLEQVYESLESVMPDFHGYLGETETKLQLFVKSISRLQVEYEAIFDAYDEEIKQLGGRETRSDAIDFFRDLEAKLEEGRQLHEQALTVLANLKDVRAANQQLCAQADDRRQAFSKEISEIRKNVPALKLTKIQQGYQQALNELQQMEKRNDRDPLGVEKKLKDWRKQLSKMEQETRTLPMLWHQFSDDLKDRIGGLRQRLKTKDGASNQVQSLAEIERLHKTLLQAIEQGDLSTLNRFNEIFTRKLQQLEAEI